MHKRADGAVARAPLDVLEVADEETEAISELLLREPGLAPKLRYASPEIEGAAVTQEGGVSAPR